MIADFKNYGTISLDRTRVDAAALALGSQTAKPFAGILTERLAGRFDPLQWHRRQIVDATMRDYAFVRELLEMQIAAHEEGNAKSPFNKIEIRDAVQVVSSISTGIGAILDVKHGKNPFEPNAFILSGGAGYFSSWMLPNRRRTAQRLREGLASLDQERGKLDPFSLTAADPFDQDKVDAYVSGAESIRNLFFLTPSEGLTTSHSRASARSDRTTFRQIVSLVGPQLADEYLAMQVIRRGVFHVQGGWNELVDTRLLSGTIGEARQLIMGREHSSRLRSLVEPDFTPQTARILDPLPQT